MVYYVYLYRDPRNNEPFYIGKGKGQRANKHVWMAQRTINGCPTYNDNSNKLKRIISIIESGYNPIIEMIYETSIEKEALDYERAKIDEYGKHPNGPLLNITSGGQGTSGYRHTDLSKAKMSEWRKGRAVTKHSEEWKQKLRDNNPGGRATRKATIKYDENWNVVEKYASRIDAMTANNIKKSRFSNNCKENGRLIDGFYYRYE